MSCSMRGRPTPNLRRQMTKQKSVDLYRTLSHTPVDKLGISKKQMNELRDAFRLFDKDGDGNITRDELNRVMRSFGQYTRNEEYTSMLEEVDVDGDGKVSFAEFVVIMVCNKNMMQEEDKEEMMDAFRVFDKHNRGYICASDLRAVLSCLGEDLNEEEIEDMIKEVDTNEDGRIDFDEFAEALAKGDLDDNEDNDDCCCNESNLI